MFADRATSVAYQSLVLKMKETDREIFLGFIRMSSNRLDHLLELINKAYDYEKECFIYTTR